MNQLESIHSVRRLFTLREPEKGETNVSYGGYSTKTSRILLHVMSLHPRLGSKQGLKLIARFDLEKFIKIIVSCA